MIRLDGYESWREQRKSIQPPVAFTEDVMRRIAEGNSTCSQTVPESTFGRRIWHACVAASVLAACIGIGLLRVQAVIVLLLANSSEGL